MLQEFKDILKEKGVEGLLPQNLPDVLLNEFCQGILNFIEFTGNPLDYKLAEKMVSTVHSDTENCINFLIKTFILNVLGNGSYHLTKLDLHNGFLCIRYHYGKELMLHRKSGIIIKQPTVDNILDLKNLPEQD